MNIPCEVTYTDGFSINITKDITKQEFIEICEQLTSLFDYSVEPLPMTEGGILFNCQGHKSIRFSLRGKWPWLNNGYKEEWKKDTTILLHKGHISNTILKAMQGAPVWSIHELHTIIIVLVTHGIECTNLPDPKKLCQFINLW
jgi:hypothetical protein